MYLVSKTVPKMQKTAKILNRKYNHLILYFSRLDQWDDHNCEILYFVIEYKMASADNWITVTNDLQPQARYSIRGLAPHTDYELKVTAHNHAGSTSMR